MRVARPRLRYSGFHELHAPIGPVCDDVSTGLAQTWPLHWYQVLVEADCTQVRGGTLVPSVAELHQANASVQAPVEEIAFHEPFEHWYQFASPADCTQVPLSTSRASVDDEHGASVVPPPEPEPE